jgi:hypothetical protein
MRAQNRLFLLDSATPECQKSQPIGMGCDRGDAVGPRRGDEMPEEGPIRHARQINSTQVDIIARGDSGRQGSTKLCHNQGRSCYGTLPMRVTSFRFPSLDYGTMTWRVWEELESWDGSLAAKETVRVPFAKWPLLAFKVTLLKTVWTVDSVVLDVN